ncbi:MAG TPA: hypothetical protein VFN10_15040 [Thermoanaerobaculia bacterium]|nr:hypothetical protein [Thermoanaerobaculia bacterium]
MNDLTAVHTFDAPIHVSVDGSLRNPFVAVAVVVVTLFLGAVTCYAVMRLRQRQYQYASVVVALVLASVGSASLFHWVAFWLQAAVSRRVISTTYFGAPPWWLLPAFLLLTGVVAVLAGAAKTKYATKRTR